jgi:Ca2+-binding EF-hand superfamily protein
MKVFVCQKCGLDTYEEELVALLKRIDYNADGAVCYADFKRAVSVFTNKKCLIDRKNSV